MFTNTRDLVIEWGDCDPAGIVFYPRYFAMFDASTHFMFAAAGLPKPQLLAEHNAVGLPMVDTRAIFKIPSSFGDHVRIVSTIREFRRSSLDVYHRLMKGDALAIECFETRVWTVRDPETGRLKSAPIPACVIAAFQD